MKNIWQVQEAKSKFSELIERTLSNGAQIVTRHGRKVAVVIPFDEYQRKCAHPNTLVEFLLTSPLRGTELHITREKSTPRKIELEP